MNDASDTPKPRLDLIERERIRGASRMIPIGTEAVNVTPEQIAGVINDVLVFASAHDIKQVVIAKALGYSPTTISEFLKCKYAGDKAQVAIDLDAWMVEEEARRSRPATTQFTWTNVAMLIQGAANYCLDYQSIGMVFGPDSAGVGKTTALTAIHQELGTQRSSLLTIDTVDASPTALLKKLCKTLRVDDGHGGGSRQRRSDRIIEALRGRSHLLLIDQIHNLCRSRTPEPFFILADIHDATKAAQLWCGTADLVKYLEAQRARSADSSLAQIRSRIFPSVDLLQQVRKGGTGVPLVTLPQIREMFAKNRLKIAPAAMRFLLDLANLPDGGCIRACVKIVEYATMLATQRNLNAIDLPILQEAARCGFTAPRAQILLTELDEVGMKAVG